MEVVSPITRPTRASRQASRERGDHARLPGPGRADQDVDSPAGGQHPVGGLRLVIGQAGAAERSECAARRSIGAVRRTGRAGLAVLAP